MLNRNPQLGRGNCTGQAEKYEEIHMSPDEELALSQVKDDDVEATEDLLDGLDDEELDGLNEYLKDLLGDADPVDEDIELVEDLPTLAEELGLDQVDVDLDTLEV
jgi:hypothetical protein